MADRASEHTVDGFPGWTRIEIKTDAGTTKRQYRSPGGTVISNGKWTKLKSDHPGMSAFTEDELKRYEIAVPSYSQSNLAVEPDYEDYEEDEVPIEEPPPEPPVKNPIASKLFPKRKRPNPNRHPDPSAQARLKGFQKNIAQPPRKENITEFPAPDVTPNKGFRTNPNNNAAAAPDLARGLSGGLQSVTSLAAMFTQVPEFAMQRPVADSLATSIANLIEPTWLNKQYGQYIAGSNDWVNIGYIGVAYTMNVAQGIQLKRQQVALMKQQAQQPQSMQQQYQQAAQQNGHAPVQQPSPAAPPVQAPNMPFKRMTGPPGIGL
jgi:hypothetical protein